MINGVVQVQVQGQQKYAVRVQIDPDKLAAKRIGLNEMDTAMAKWNLNPPLGTCTGRSIAIHITTNGQLKNAAQFRQLMVSKSTPPGASAGRRAT